MPKNSPNSDKSKTATTSTLINRNQPRLPSHVPATLPNVPSEWYTHKPPVSSKHAGSSASHTLVAPGTAATKNPAKRSSHFDFGPPPEIVIESAEAQSRSPKKRSLYLLKDAKRRRRDHLESTRLLSFKDLQHHKYFLS